MLFWTSFSSAEDNTDVHELLLLALVRCGTWHVLWKALWQHGQNSRQQVKAGIAHVADVCRNST